MLIDSKDKLQLVLDWLDTQEEVAYDLETAPQELDKPQQAVMPKKNQVIGIAVGTDTQAFYVAHKHLESGAFIDYISKEDLAPFFEKLKTKKLVTFRGSFDLQTTAQYFKVDLCDSLWSEIQLARHLNNENETAWIKLKVLAQQVFGDSAVSEQLDLNEAITAAGGTPGQVWLGPLNLVSDYGCKDTIITFKLHQKYIKELQEQGLLQFYLYDEVMPMYKHVIIPMESVGVRLDIPRLQQAQAEITEDIRNLELRIRELIKPYTGEFDAWFLDKTIKPTASGAFAQAAAKFYAVEGVRTKTGTLSFGAKAMEVMPDSLFKRFINGEERLPAADVVEIQKQMRGDKESFKLTSKDHLKRVFFDNLKEEPLSFTKVKKEPQVDDQFLESIKHKYEFVSLLIDFNKLGKLKATYIDQFLDAQQDGMFYPNWNQHTTSTGRLSGNLQQLPRKKTSEELSPLPLKYNNMIREFFIAREGRRLIGADYESLEVVVFADDAGDEPLLDIIRKDKDFYSEIAINALQLKDYSSDKSAPNFLKLHKPEIRQNAKPYALGLRYLMGDYKLSKTLNISQYEAKIIMKNYFNSFPGLKIRIDELVSEACTVGFVSSKFGRRCRLEWAKKLQSMYGNVLKDSLKVWERYHNSPEKYNEIKFLQNKYLSDLRAAVNFPIQSGASSIVNRASIAVNRELKARGLDAILCMNVHDELIIDSAAECAEEAATILQDKMENTTKLSVPLLAEPQIGTRYSELK